MSFRALHLEIPGFTGAWRGLFSAVLVGSVLILCGCDQQVVPVEAKTGQDDISTFLTYQDVLVGKMTNDVERVFGKPNGVFEKRNGITWMYSRWRVEFDTRGIVLKLERDIAATRTADQGAAKSMALTSPPPTQATEMDAGRSIVRVANGGQQVDLDSVMPSGKVVIVDFYADWCGPCQKIAPHLEKLAAENPNVALVKIDIVKWGTPVTQQYGINSVPNIRVFDASGHPVGQPTSSFSKVQAYVKQAGE